MSAEPFAADSVGRAPGTPRGARSHRGLALLRLALILLSLVVFLPLFLIHRLLCRTEAARFRAGAAWTRFWFRLIARILGWRIRTNGEVPPACFIAPNHVGYGDILVMSVATGCFFVSKTEVVSWPLIGRLLLMTEHMTVSRSVARDLARTTSLIAARLRHGHRVCVFLEGTTTGGDRVLRLMTPLVKPAVEAAAPIVPASIRWTCPDPDFHLSEDAAYWTREHTFGPHALRMFGIPSLEVEITFDSPVDPASMPRRELAHHVRERIVALYRPALSLDAPAPEASWVAPGLRGTEREQ